jgi:hypothetical protein
MLAPTRAVEEVCAVWAIRKNSVPKALPSRKRIQEVKRAVGRVYQYPTAVYKLRRSFQSPPLEGDEDGAPPDIAAGLNIDEVTMKLVDDDVMHNLMTT